MNPRPKIFLLAYVVTLLLSFFVVIPMGMISTNFNGHCLLYATGNFTIDPQHNASQFQLSSWGSSSNCNYILFVGIFWLLVSAAFIWSYSLLVWKEHDRAPFGSFLMMIANVIVTFFSFVAALILSVGLGSFCKGLFKISNVLTCSATDINFPPDITANGFFTQIHVAQFGIWSGFFVWLIASILAFLKVYYYHKNDDLLQSLAYEKETLLHRHRQYQQVHSDNVTDPKA